MKVARYEVPGIGQKYGPVPEGRLKSGCALNYACRISRLPRIRRPSGTRPFFVCYPGNTLSGYYREVPPGTGPYFLPIRGTSYLATFIQSLRDKNLASH